MKPVSQLALEWTGSAWQSESTLHQLSPYIGKIKSSMAASLVDQFTKQKTVVYDPFSGCGTFAFESWRAGRHVIGNDLNPYAALLTRAKLYPYHTLKQALADLERVDACVKRRCSYPDLRSVPSWVRQFFHRETLRETLIWTDVLQNRRRWFLLACLMGILHHQRPGFLSFPSSHTVPYLRLKKYPLSDYPKLYEYRGVRERLEAKVRRAFRRVPKLDFSLTRRCYKADAEVLSLRTPVSAILTSPPYMRQLDYARDNRLRLWFLGYDDWHSLDQSISPGEKNFLDLMEKCFRRWRMLLSPGGYCVLVIGDKCRRSRRTELPSTVANIAAMTAGFSVVSSYEDTIPNKRRVRRGLSGSSSEIILVLRNSRR